LPEVILPERETRPPAFWAAASAWATKGLACCARVERIRPGRMRNSLSSDMGRPRTVQIIKENQEEERAAHGARQRRTVRDAPET